MHFLVFLSALVAFAAGVPLNSTSPKLEGRIIGGLIASIEDLPYQVAVLLTGNHKCGGAIITKRWVVTAAHCFPDVERVQHIQVRAGSALWKSGGTTYDVIRIIPHENFNMSIEASEYEYDIALLKVRTAFTYNVTVRNIRLEEHEVSERTPAFVAGWGATRLVYEIPDGYSETLLQATVNTINDRLCKDIVGDKALITANMICTDTTDGKSPCNYDSGGPLVANDKLVGIVAKALKCGTTGIPAVYTKVSALLPWIKAQICPFRFFRRCCLFSSGLET